MTDQTQKIHIIGAGIMGLMIARNLLEAGKGVILYDKGRVGAESSWAGGGILSPLDPWRYPSSITKLVLRSQVLYPEIARELYQSTGTDPELEKTGMLMLSLADNGIALEWADQHQVNVSIVEQETLSRIEPNLAPSFHKQALIFPEIGHIRNPRLISSLRTDLLQKGCEILENTEINDISVDGDMVQKLVTNKGEIEARQVIVCAGAWTGRLLTSLGLSVPIEPVAGQMLLYKAVPGVVNNILLKNKRYLIPRRDGRILVGSTLEHEGFNKQTTGEARKSLQDSALELVPDLANYPIEAHWAGLRPGSPRGIPYMGVYPGMENLWVCSGHYRNGLILAPASAEFMTSLVLGRKPPMDQPEFALDRAS